MNEYEKALMDFGEALIKFYESQIEKNRAFAALNRNWNELADGFNRYVDKVGQGDKLPLIVQNSDQPADGDEPSIEKDI